MVKYTNTGSITPNTVFTFVWGVPVSHPPRSLLHHIDMFTTSTHLYRLVRRVLGTDHVEVPGGFPVYQSQQLILLFKVRAVMHSVNQETYLEEILDEGNGILERMYGRRALHYQPTSGEFVNRTLALPGAFMEQIGSHSSVKDHIGIFPDGHPSAMDELKQFFGISGSGDVDIFGPLTLTLKWGLPLVAGYALYQSYKIARSVSRVAQ